MGSDSNLLFKNFLQGGQSGIQGLARNRPQPFHQPHFVHGVQLIEHDQPLGAGVGDRHAKRRGKALAISSVKCNTHQ